ncbi:transcriptional regulator [Pseudomonas sp. Choline-3u-10]|jgi:sigma-E factor negative regulatory protein RseC|uniref:SoxR reducing system RseC family protein n=1 Tax=Pseudomonadaceae TaxID=135621 RepID=UPI000617D82E|nr:MULTISPECIES: SoxR reducing system RseC family protein [Pseudomonadaceae]MAL36533.1 transcriptional regulator [Pseudomonas sp.]MBU0949051.1 SoxR reducing system RseC family protein [Gammaproteobacteria bacterium]KJJ63164.1 alginate regulatory protein [Pseudomonas sp. 10B238]MBK3796418.1 transcriptional regulator [Stutzerimonas stutzeri]MBK3876921.1 transcriptional regulator [Stutzerimonas stutzeri]|tara:strand:- start:3564 stop:4013 length:450 start_codon:yes stop_codon:yes gene_type:complete
MIEETGRVVALAPGAVWVEAERSSTCSGCSVRSGCGQGLVDRLGIRERRGLILALCDLRLSVGDTVVVGIRESVLLHGAVLVYLFPLIMLFIFAVIASQLSAPEPYVMLAGLGGFLVAWLLVRKRSQQTSIDPALQPVVLRAALAAKAG